MWIPIIIILLSQCTLYCLSLVNSKILSTRQRNDPIDDVRRLSLLAFLLLFVTDVFVIWYQKTHGDVNMVHGQGSRTILSWLASSIFLVCSVMRAWSIFCIVKKTYVYPFKRWGVSDWDMIYEERSFWTIWTSVCTHIWFALYHKSTSTVITTVVYMMLILLFSFAPKITVPSFRTPAMPSHMHRSKGSVWFIL